MPAGILAGNFIIGLVMGAIGAICSYAVPSVARAASPDGRQLLQQLTKAAEKEGQLDLMISSSVGGEKGARALIDAFKRRFGLEIKINADLAGQESQKFNQAVAETKAGIPPTFDLMQGTAPNVLNLKDAGGIEPIEDWGTLVAEIAPEVYKIREKISPQILAGYGFMWSTRTGVILYNPKLISERDLPRTWKQMGDPKYKGASSVPPWIGTTLMGLLKYDKEEWLEIVRSWGSNKRDILTYDAGAQRVLLGDLKFTQGNADTYFEHKSADSKAPIGMAFFEDITTLTQVFYTARKGARHANAAKLFALWVTSAEANEIFEKYGFIENLVLGRDAASRRILKLLEQENIKPASWFDNPKTVEKFRWLETREGQEYQKAIAKAQREGK